MRFSHDAADADISTIEDIDSTANADEMEDVDTRKDAGAIGQVGPIVKVDESEEIRRFFDAG